MAFLLRGLMIKLLPQLNTTRGPNLTEPWFICTKFKAGHLNHSPHTEPAVLDLDLDVLGLDLELVDLDLFDLDLWEFRVRNWTKDN